MKKGFYKLRTLSERLEELSYYILLNISNQNHSLIQRDFILNGRYNNKIGLENVLFVLDSLRADDSVCSYIIKTSKTGSKEVIIDFLLGEKGKIYWKLSKPLFFQSERTIQKLWKIMCSGLTMEQIYKI